MRLLSEPALMFMLMVATVRMHMVMFYLLMDVDMVMVFPKQEHDSHRHDQ